MFTKKTSKGSLLSQTFSVGSQHLWVVKQGGPIILGCGLLTLDHTLILPALSLPVHKVLKKQLGMLS